MLGNSSSENPGLVTGQQVDFVHSGGTGKVLESIPLENAANRERSTAVTCGTLLSRENEPEASSRRVEKEVTEREEKTKDGKPAIDEEEEQTQELISAILLRYCRGAEACSAGQNARKRKEQLQTKESPDSSSKSDSRGQDSMQQNGSPQQKSSTSDRMQATPELMLFEELVELCTTREVTPHLLELVRELLSRTRVIPHYNNSGGSAQQQALLDEVKRREYAQQLILILLNQLKERKLQERMGLQPSVSTEALVQRVQEALYATTNPKVSSSHVSNQFSSSVPAENTRGSSVSSLLFAAPRPMSMSCEEAGSRSIRIPVHTTAACTRTTRFAAQQFTNVSSQPHLVDGRTAPADAPEFVVPGESVSDEANSTRYSFPSFLFQPPAAASPHFDIPFAMGPPPFTAYSRVFEPPSSPWCEFNGTSVQPPLSQSVESRAGSRLFHSLFAEPQPACITAGNTSGHITTAVPLRDPGACETVPSRLSIWQENRKQLYVENGTDDDDDDDVVEDLRSYMHAAATLVNDDDDHGVVGEQKLTPAEKEHREEMNRIGADESKSREGILVSVAETELLTGVSLSETNHTEQEACIVPVPRPPATPVLGFQGSPSRSGEEHATPEAVSPPTTGISPLHTGAALTPVAYKIGFNVSLLPTSGSPNRFTQSPSLLFNFNEELEGVAASDAGDTDTNPRGQAATPLYQEPDDDADTVVAPSDHSIAPLTPTPTSIVSRYRGAESHEGEGDIAVPTRLGEDTKPEVQQHVFTMMSDSSSPTRLGDTNLWKHSSLAFTAPMLTSALNSNGSACSTMDVTPQNTKSAFADTERHLSPIPSPLQQVHSQQKIGLYLRPRDVNQPVEPASDVKAIQDVAAPSQRRQVGFGDVVVLHRRETRSTDNTTTDRRK